MNLPARKPASILICLVMAWLLSLGGALGVTQLQLAHKVDELVAKELPKAVESGLQSRINQPGEVEQLIKQINGDLQNLQVKQYIKTLQSFWIRLEAVDDASATKSPHFISWKTGDQQRIVSYRWGYKIHWLPLILEALVWSALFTTVCFLIPRPISAERQHWLKWLVTRGEPRTQATLLTSGLVQPLSKPTSTWLTALVEHLPFADALVLARAAAAENIFSEQLSWLLLGWKLDPSNPTTAIEIAKAPLCLEFDLSRQQIGIHGFTINISQTPLFYYLWYALQREGGEGWVLNPSSQQADTNAATSLIALMRDYQGHPKAIAELEEQGLRAKTLDQNRSKIKDALSSALGNELALQFLFENEKDKRTGRSRYRLAQALPVSIVK